MATNTEAAILERLIEPDQEGLPPEAARYILSLDFRQTDVDRMQELAARSHGGVLTGEEQAELESYLHVGHLLALMQSKARTSLKKAG